MCRGAGHTVDHVIQAGRKRIITAGVPIRTNEKLRESRLFTSIWVFISRSLSIMLRVYSSYRAMKIFSAAGLITFALGFLIGLRFLYYFLWAPEESGLHTQSLILAAVLMLAGFQMILTGIVADLINASRGVLEDVAGWRAREKGPASYGSRPRTKVRGSLGTPRPLWLMANS